MLKNADEWCNAFINKDISIDEYMTGMEYFYTFHSQWNNLPGDFFDENPSKTPGNGNGYNYFDQKKLIILLFNNNITNNNTISDFFIRALLFAFHGNRSGKHMKNDNNQKSNFSSFLSSIPRCMSDCINCFDRAYHLKKITKAEYDNLLNKYWKKPAQIKIPKNL